MSTTVLDYLIKHDETRAADKLKLEKYLIKTDFQAQFPKFMGGLLLESYRERDFLREQYRDKEKEALLTYLESYVFPTNRLGVPTTASEKMVRSGDFGEALLGKLAKEVHGLDVPFEKMMWKLRNDKSSFCTDIFAHNSSGDIKDLHYYEVKVRQTLAKEKSHKRGSNYYISIVAHDSLMFDQNLPSEQIADFLRRMHFEKSKLFQEANNSNEASKFRKLSLEYGKIVDNSQSHNRHYCVGLVLDQDKGFQEEVITDLETLPPELKPLLVSVVLLPNLKDLIESSFKAAFEKACDYVYGVME